MFYTFATIELVSNITYNINIRKIKCIHFTNRKKLRTINILN